MIHKFTQQFQLGSKCLKPYNKKSAMGSKVETPSLMTSWGAQLGDVPWSEYPRPQLRRNSWWQSLNGTWRCRISKMGAEPADLLEMREMDQQILVPFCFSSQFWAKLFGFLWRSNVGKFIGMVPSTVISLGLESQLGGVMRKLDPDEELWYHRTFELRKLENSRPGTKKHFWFSWFTGVDFLVFT